MARAPKPSDPLLAALIAKLPADNSDWPVERQLAWLNLMAIAFGSVYGGDAATRLGLMGNTDVGAAPKASPPPKPSAEGKPKPPTHPFIIDEQGYVRNAKGKRVMPADVSDAICDLRGEADLRDIVWADDSTGLNGRDLIITTG